RELRDVSVDVRGVEAELLRARDQRGEVLPRETVPGESDSDLRHPSRGPAFARLRLAARLLRRLAAHARRPTCRDAWISASALFASRSSPRQTRSSACASGTRITSITSSSSGRLATRVRSNAANRWITSSV